MPSVVKKIEAPAAAKGAPLTFSPAGLNLISTPEAAALMGYSEATLRNYVWLNSLSIEERASRKLQVPPAGLPVPTRKSGRLVWPLAEVTKFVEQKSKSAT